MNTKWPSEYFPVLDLRKVTGNRSWDQCQELEEWYRVINEYWKKKASGSSTT